MTDDRAARFARYLNGQMAPDDAAAFERELDVDAALAAQFEQWSEQQLPPGALLVEGEAPPVDLVRGVEARIRRRSQGRFFAQQPGPRPGGLALPVFLALSIVIMMVAVVANLDRFAGAPALGDTSDAVEGDAPERDAPECDAPEGDAATGRRRGGGTSGDSAPVDGTAHGQTPLEEREDYGAVMLAPAVTPGRVSNDPILPMVRRGPVMIFTLTGDRDATLTALEERFGAHRISALDGEWIIRVDRTEVPEAIARLEGLGGTMTSEDRELTVEDLDRPAIHVRLRRR